MQWITCTCHALAGGGLTKFADEVEKLVDAGTDALYISGVEADTLCGFTNDIAGVDSAKRVKEPNLELLSQAARRGQSARPAHGLGRTPARSHPGL